MNDPEEEILLDMNCESNEEVRDVLYLKYRKTINQVVKKYLQSARKAGLDLNDLYQEANVGFSDALNKYDSKKDTSLKTFINVCIERRLMNVIAKANTIKNKVLQDTLSLDYEYDDEGLPLKEFIIDENLDPSQKYLEKEQFEFIKDKMKNELSGFEYQVFEYLLMGLNYTEIGKLLDKTKKQIDNTVQRVRLKLKAVLGGKNE